MKFFNFKDERNASQCALDGEVSRIKGNYKQALKDFNKAIELDANNDMFYASRSIVKKELKDIEGAKKDIEKALELNPNVKRYIKHQASL